MEKIRSYYPDVKCYFDDITNPTYPNFTITFVENVAEPIGQNLYRFWLYLSVQYRESSDPALTIQLNTKLNRVGNVLNSLLQKIEVYGSTRRCKDLRTSIIDNVMQAFFTITLIGSMPEEQAPIMNILEHKEEIK